MANINNPNESTASSAVNNSNEGAISDILLKCLMHWPWFLLSLAIFVAGAYFYLKRQEPVFQRGASILIKSESSGNTIKGSNVSLGADLGIFENSSLVEDEMSAMTSPTIVSEVVDTLKLYMNYQAPGKFHDVTLYGRTLPIEVVMVDFDPDMYAALEVEFDKAGNVELSHFQKMDQEHGAVCKGKMNEMISTPLGKILVVPTAFYANQEGTIKVDHYSRENALNAFMARLSSQLQSKTSSIIDLTYNDVSIARAEDCLDMLIKVYNESWLRDRNLLATTTSEFINERLLILESELDTVDSNIFDYQSSNFIPNLEAQSGLSMTNADAAEKEAVELTNKIQVLQYLASYVEASNHKNQLIPANTGIGVASIESQIATYNTKMLARNNMVANSSENNPLVIEMDAELESLYPTILTSIKTQIKLFNNQLASTRSMQSQARGNLAKNPQQNKHLLGITRQQGVKEALYLFLLQKREENELSQAFTATNTRIIKKPCGSSIPISPKSRSILLIALALGFGLPFAFVYLFDKMDNTVRGRRDVLGLAAPFAGEIPEVAGRRGGFFTRLMDNINRYVLHRSGKKRGKFSRENMHLDVKDNSHNVINEAFRVVRGNLEFMNTKDTKVFMITSANPGSGKTYISTNLSASFAAKNKRVLLIDLDLRKRSLTSFIGKKKAFGISDYLAGHIDNFHDAILHDEIFHNMDILPCGTLPPNPSEVLYSERLSEMMQQVRNEYDVIFLDCPPVEVVTDVAIIAPHADRTIFIVRAGVYLRNMLNEIDNMYESKKFGEMCVLLNGTEGAGGRYGYSRYSYNYGYSYGYSYGNES
ncbi:MAG: polysaccharide biosynthesis tyrosine autokinase [Bacteroidales bacterium]|nr:polysaccharide biosynthesis tyrosine autokinase [Bacteroidales bacterium]